MIWNDATRKLPANNGNYLVILSSASRSAHCKLWAGMGKPEIASFYAGGYGSSGNPWNARGSLVVSYWMELPAFNMAWEAGEEDEPGRWVVKLP